MNTGIGIDLGGTRIKGVVVNSNGEVLHQLYTDTNDGDGAVWKNAVLQTVQTLAEYISTEPSSIGISAPGLPNEQNSAISFMPPPSLLLPHH